MSQNSQNGGPAGEGVTIVCLLERRFERTVSTLIGLFVVLMPKQAAKADYCGCWADYAFCQGNASLDFEQCASDAYDAYQDCVNTQGVSACEGPYDVALALCEYHWIDAEYECDSTLDSCLSNCGQGGGAAAGGVCSVGDYTGLSVSGATYLGGVFNDCVSNGGDAFTGAGFSRTGFDNCMSGTGGTDQTFCCREQTNDLILTYDGCTLDPRNTDCRRCVTY